MASDGKKIGDLLVLIGGLIGLIQGILLVLGTPFAILPGFSIGLDVFLSGILAIIFSLIVLVNSGFVKISALEFKNKWLVILIMGILLYLFGSGLGGVLVILGAILIFIL
ncbi:MAG: hypothetical protein ACTSV3_04825 [Candidatus Thorarchaeota archaeon]|nr:MAG: hypothetical protein DRO87_06160 [Candidatus Thorarchaeota archaeon]